MDIGLSTTKNIGHWADDAKFEKRKQLLKHIAAG
jgi:hypothetical protein